MYRYYCRYYFEVCYFKFKVGYLYKLSHAASEDYDGDDLTYTFIGQNDRFMDSSTQTILTIPDGIFEDIEEFKLNMFVNDPSRISIGSPGMMTVFIQGKV